MPTSVKEFPVTQSEALSPVIIDLRRAIPSLSGVLIATLDGEPIAYDFQDHEADNVAAMAATAAGLGGRVSERVGLGDLAEVVISGTKGFFVVYAAGNEGVLVLDAPITTNLGLLRVEARRAIAKIEEAF